MSDKYRPICSLKDNPSTGGKGPTSCGGAKGKPVYLCGPVSEALSGEDIVAGPVIVVTTTLGGGSGQEPVPREPK